MALLALLLIMNLKETLPKRQPFKWELLRISKNEVIAKEALPAAIVTFLSYISLGAILTLIPDWTEAVGFANKGIFFVVFTISSLLVRFVAGKLSDRYGRTKVIIVGLFLLLIAMLLMGFFKTQTGLLMGGVVYGLSMGIVSRLSTHGP